MSDTAIAVEDVTKRYGDVSALSAVSLTVERGTALGVIGTNGAGKSTLFRLLVGHEAPDAGDVRVLGRDPTAGPAVRERVGYLPDTAGFHPTLTGREVLRFHARQRAVANVDRRVERTLHTVGLAEAADRRVGGYSNGMGRRLGLATALLGSPELLLLDEPTAGLDPDGVAAFDEVLRSVRADTDVTVVLTSHVLDEVAELCDRVAVLDGGELRTTGDVAELAREHVDTVEIRLRLAPGTDPAAAALTDVAAGVAVERRGADRLRLTCPGAAAFDVLTAAHERLALDGFEVDEPGLAATFRAAVDVEGGESA